MNGRSSPWSRSRHCSEPHDENSPENEIRQEWRRSHRTQRTGRKSWVFRLLGEAGSHPERLAVDDAERHYREGLALATDLGMSPLVAHCHLGLGKLYGRIGKRQAQEHFTTATTMYREMDMRFWLEQAEGAAKEAG